MTTRPRHRDIHHPVLRQGTIVHYILPYAQTLELVGRQVGIVLSRDAYNLTNDRPCICPILYGATRVNQAWGIAIPTDTELDSYLRPDLASFIAMDYGQIRPVTGPAGRHHLFPAELTRAAAQQFVANLNPPPAKRAQRAARFAAHGEEHGEQFLAHGEIGWTTHFPRNYSDRTDPAIFINLTLPEIYRETGMALVARAYSNTDRFNLRYDVAMRDSHWFKRGFFNSNDIRVLPIAGLLSKSPERLPFQAGQRVVKAFAKKGFGTFDAAAYAEILGRYDTPIGQLPAFVLSAGPNRTLHPRR